MVGRWDVRAESSQRIPQSPSSFWVWGAGLIPGDWGSWVLAVADLPLGLGLPDSANKNTECPVLFEFEIKNEYF